MSGVLETMPVASGTTADSSSTTVPRCSSRATREASSVRSGSSSTMIRKLSRSWETRGWATGSVGPSGARKASMTPATPSRSAISCRIGMSAAPSSAVRASSARSTPSTSKVTSSEVSAVELSSSRPSWLSAPGTRGSPECSWAKSPGPTRPKARARHAATASAQAVTVTRGRRITPRARASSTGQVSHRRHVGRSQGFLSSGRRGCRSVVVVAQTPETDTAGVPVQRAAGHVRRASILGERARRVVAASGPPTWTCSLPSRESGLAAETERSVLDLVLRVGEAMIATGAPVADVTAALLRLAAGYGVTNCHVDITFISISASIDREDDPITKMRVITVRTSDYSRMADLFAMVDEVAAGKLPLERAHGRLEQVLRTPHPYRRWVVTLALGVMAAGISGLLGGGWLVALVAATTTIVIDRTLRVLRRWGLPYLFQQAAGATIATMVAILILWGQDMFGWDRSALPPSLVVASGIVVLLAGMQLVGAAEDAISGYPLTAAAKSFEVALYTVGLVVGIGFMLDLGRRLGIPLYIGDVFGSAPAGLVQIACGAVIEIGRAHV